MIVQALRKTRWGSIMVWRTQQLCSSNYNFSKLKTVNRHHVFQFWWWTHYDAERHYNIDSGSNKSILLTRHMLLFERRMFSLVFLSFCSMLSKTQYDFTLCNLSFKKKHWLKTQNYFNLKAQWNKLALWEYFIIPFHLYIYICIVILKLVS